MTTSNGPTFRPGVERLEGRDVPASISFPDANGVVTFIGSAGDDFVTVKYDSTLTRVVISNWDVSVVTDRSRVTMVKFYGLGGDDFFSNATAIRTTAYGGWGDDILIGGTNDDYLYGGGDDDVLIGEWTGSGSDTLYGGDGADELYGGGGSDRLDGGDDGVTDLLWGGGSADVFYIHGFEDVAMDPDGGDVFVLT
jgi:Ca2+-binding RTX toxin-like protein